MKIKLMIFGYSSPPITEEVQPNQTIGEVKTRIMNESWPKDHPTFPKVDDIRQLRIFYNGRELLNSSKVKSAIPVEKSGDGPIEPVVQVMAAQIRSHKQDDTGEFSCSCRIL